MKTYKIKLLTSQGVKVVIYKDNQDLGEFTSEIAAKYGDFITLESNEIK